jgi:hypothetical protein
MNNRAQIDALLDGSIMLGLGYLGVNLDESSREQLATKLLLRSVHVQAATQACRSQISPLPIVDPSPRDW